MEVDENENEIILACLAAAAKEPSNEDRRGNSNPLLAKYTEAAMPAIHDIAPMALLEGIDKKQLTSWLQMATGKVLARPFGLEVGYQPNHAEIAKTLIAAVNEITGQNNIAVAAPTRDKKDPEKKKHPITFLIHNLTPNGVNLLLERKVWSSNAISFQVSPMNTEKPNFLFTLMGLLTQEPAHVEELVAEAWKDPVTNAFVANLIKQAPAQEQYQLSLDIDNFFNSTTVTSLEIKTKGGRGDPHYNIYADGKTLKNDEIWTEIRNFLKGRTYASPLCGKGMAKKNFYYCTLCHGRDHPRGLCPFPKTPGWNGEGRRSLNPNSTHAENTGPPHGRVSMRGPSFPNQGHRGNGLNISIRRPF